MSAVEYKAPQPTPENENRIAIFLAGSIDMGKATDWQLEVVKKLKDLPVDFYNPRRDDWDSSWKQDISDDKFREQVEWELDHMDEADIIVVYFDPKGQAPITLLELGLHAASGQLIVCCPPGYWRRGNVQIVCNRHDVPLVDTLEELIAEARKRIGELSDTPQNLRNLMKRLNNIL